MALGTTLLLDEDGDLVFDATTQRHALIEGGGALAQDLKQRLLAESGVDPIHPQVGLDLVELFEGSYDANLWEARIRDQIQADLRVKSIDSFDITTPDALRAVEATVSATAEDGTTFDLALTVGVRS